MLTSYSLINKGNLGKQVSLALTLDNLPNESKYIHCSSFYVRVSIVYHETFSRHEKSNFTFEFGT